MGNGLQMEEGEVVWTKAGLKGVGLVGWWWWWWCGGGGGEPGFEWRPPQSLWLTQLPLLPLLTPLQVLTELFDVGLFFLLFLPRMSSMKKEVWPLPDPRVWAVLLQLTPEMGPLVVRIPRVPFPMKLAASVARFGANVCRWACPCIWKAAYGSKLTEQGEFDSILICKTNGVALVWRREKNRKKKENKRKLCYLHLKMFSHSLSQTIPELTIYEITDSS